MRVKKFVNEILSSIKSLALLCSIDAFKTNHFDSIVIMENLQYHPKASKAFNLVFYISKKSTLRYGHKCVKTTFRNIQAIANQMSNTVKSYPVNKPRVHTILTDQIFYQISYIIFSQCCDDSGFHPETMRKSTSYVIFATFSDIKRTDTTNTEIARIKPKYNFPNGRNNQRTA